MSIIHNYKAIREACDNISKDILGPRTDPETAYLDELQKEVAMPYPDTPPSQKTRFSVTVPGRGGGKAGMGVLKSPGKVCPNCDETCFPKGTKWYCDNCGWSGHQ